MINRRPLREPTKATKIANVGIAAVARFPLRTKYNSVIYMTVRST